MASTLFTQGINLTRVDTTEDHPLGLEVWGDDGRRYRYVRADDAITDENAVTYDFAAAGSGVAGDVPNLVRHTAAIDEPVVGYADVGVNIAAGEYFWLVVHGVVEGANVATDVVQGDVLVSGATAGQLERHVSTATNPSDADHDALAKAALGGVGVMALEDDTAGVADVYVSGG